MYLRSELRQFLFKKDENPDLVDQVSENDGLTALRFQKMGPMKWDWEGTGYTATVDYGMGGDSNIVLSDVKVDKFKFLAQEGGTVTVSCRMIAHPDEKVIGPLCNFIQRDIVLTITPPEPQTVQELFGDEKKAA